VPAAVHEKGYRTLTVEDITTRAGVSRRTFYENFRDKAYRRMTELLLTYLPWIPVIQPSEDYGMQKYVSFTPNGDQQLDIRRFNFRMRRA